MILTLPQLLVGLVILVMLWMVFDWVMGGLKDRAEESRLGAMGRHCHLCGRRYREGRKVKESRCPDCGARNRRGGHRKLG